MPGVFSHKNLIQGIRSKTVHVEAKKECLLCEGTGEVPDDVLDTDSMQFMRGVGTRKCICTVE
jgi:hypothetical protein